MLVLMPEPALAQVQDVSPLRLALQTRQSAFHGGGAPKKSFVSRSVFTLRVVLGVYETEGDMPCPTNPLF